MWSDNETSEDLLGFQVHARLLIDVINDETVLPVTIGVFGDWGSGKSSVLKIIQEELKGEKDDDLKDDTLVLYFNGWTFEGYDDAKAALLEAIIERFEKHKKLGSIIKDEAKKLLRSVRWMRAIGLGFKKVVVPAAAAYFTGGLSLIPFLANEFKSIDPEKLKDTLTGAQAEEYLSKIIKTQSNEDDVTLVREFRDDFETMLKKSKIKKLVVIIDDLDRCTHERIIENLEAIKLFLNVEKTAFIIGADPRIVHHAIEHRYRTELPSPKHDPQTNNPRIINDYLEKLIQIPYTLPKLSDSEVETYMTLLFAKRELTTSYPKVIEQFAEFRKKNRYEVFGYADIEKIVEPAEKENLKKSISLVASLSSIIAQGLNGNPRQIKRFLNSFTLRHRLATIAEIPGFQIDVLGKLMILEYSFSNLFTELYTWQSVQQGEPKELRELEKLAENEKPEEEIKQKFTGSWADPQVIRWLKTEPKLSNVDLRDYYWIARDQLLSSMSGGSLIPAHLRSLFRSLVEYKSDAITKGKVTNEVLPLTGSHLVHFYSLLEKELIKNPGEANIHKIYIEMIRQKVPDSVTMYQNAVIKISDHELIPFSLEPVMTLAAKDNPDIQTVYAKFNSQSKIGKRLKPK
jgi:predicted KAP-like P-loop ATPase